MTDEEYEAYDGKWGRMIVDFLQSLLPDTGNLPAQTIILHLIKDESGFFYLIEDDFTRLYEAILKYDF